ncbi:DUF192 domain-containing protein [Methylovirgula sp. 4M-Z18]
MQFFRSWRVSALLKMLFLAAALVWVVPVAAGEGQFEKLTIVTAAGPKDFSVEVMRTDAEHQKGLMFRRYLAADRGMLFDFNAEQEVGFWMKNTYLPLDMLFIAKDGHIINIAQNTEPMSEDVIPSEGKVLGVLEVNGGTASRLGIKIGDMVQHPIFGK